jgi:hypothetical protein
VSYRVSITPTGQRSVEALRGKVRKSFDAAVKRLAADGCAGGDYRLTGEDIEHICAIHLYGRHRALVPYNSAGVTTNPSRSAPRRRRPSTVTKRHPLIFARATYSAS